MAAKGGMTHQRPAVGGPRGPGQEPMSLADLAGLREATYRLIGRAFLYPDEERVGVLAAAARDLRQESETLTRFAFFDVWSRLLSKLETLGQREISKTQAAYVTMFVVNSGGIPCPPYESIQREQPGWPAGWLLAQVEREYSAAGLAPSPVLGEMPDHVAVELEFVSVLCGLEAQAWEKENLGHGLGALRRQKEFLESHLARWFPKFAQQVKAADKGGVYAAVSEDAQAFMGYDIDLVEALLEAPPPASALP